jgi:hypothetical protein
MAAAIAVELGCSVAQVPIRQLQQELEAAGVVIHFDDALIPKDETV